MPPFKNTFAQMQRFALVCAVSFVIDAGLYFALANLADTDVGIAKRTSFAVMAIWGFLAHKRFTFRNRHKSLRQPIYFALVYASGWLINSLTHDFALKASQDVTFSFLAATALWACWNFSCQKLFVFRHRYDQKRQDSSASGGA